VLTGGLFQGNECTEAGCLGGGLFATVNLVLTDTHFVSNTSRSNGGGVAVVVNAMLSGALFQDNWCSQAGCRGGGLDYRGVGASSARIENTLFAGNQAVAGGDAAHFDGPGTVTVLHATIASPTVGGGSALLVTSGTLTVTNTLVAGFATGIEQAGGAASEDYNLFAMVGVHTAGGVSSGGHSFSGQPDFRDPSSGDYRLGPASDALDAGIDAGVSEDFEGDPRPQQGGPDIGYDESYWEWLYLPIIIRQLPPPN
jgi:hypothetical protein